jgi:hypothetical protein
MLESKFKKDMKDRIKKRLVNKGLHFIEPKLITRSEPDLVILGQDTWAALEFKRFENADTQPNQKYKIDKLNNLSYAQFCYPENLEEVLHDLEELFSS